VPIETITTQAILCDHRKYGFQCQNRASCMIPLGGSDAMFYCDEHHDHEHYRDCELLPRDATWQTSKSS
jgi:hypothetical protein